MITVTLPNGKVYTYGPRRRAAAEALATKTGGTVSVERPRPTRCPHGEYIGWCDRGACDE